jgi:hypothetical protein
MYSTWGPGKEYQRPRRGIPEAEEKNTYGSGEVFLRFCRVITEAKERNTVPYS